jgi:uncharacterized protein
VADLFRIETDHTELSWSDPSPHSTQPEGHLAVSPAGPTAKINIRRLGLPDEAANNPKIQAGPCLYEETAYNLLLRSTDKRPVELRHRDPTILQALNFSAGDSILHGTINFRSQIGRSRFSVYVDGKAEYDFEVEVFPSKLDYVADYDAMLADIQDILTALVLEYLRSTFKLGCSVDTESSSRLEWILLLRHIVEDLERGLRYIERHPHHGLARERVATRIEKLRRPDSTTAKTLAHGKGHGRKSKTASGLALHDKLPERRARLTWDTPEHRWFASQLTRIRRSLAEIHVAERKRPSENRLRQRPILEEIEYLENRLAALQNLEPIAQAKGVVPTGFTSLTLQSKPGYREAYRACLILLQGLRVNGGPVGLSVKDIYRLYEYWCYLALVRTVAKIFGQQVSFRELFSIEQSGLHVRLKQGTVQTVKFFNDPRTIELTYNPRYDVDGVIAPQKPDVVLTIRDPDYKPKRLVFDVKYRINTEPAYVKRIGCPGPPQTAIDALHRYRDAILDETGFQGVRSETYKRTVVEAVALFPYADVEDQFRSTSLWLSLDKVGIGAIPLLPRETRYLEEWLQIVLARGGWATAEDAIPYSSHDKLHEWQQAEKELVLIGVLRGNVEEQIERIRQERRYSTPFDESEKRQVIARYIAFYSPASNGTAAAITHLGEVENFEIKGPHLIYQLRELTKLETPIENRGPRTLIRRVEHDPWTSRLAVLRANELREIFLDSSAEWRLVEQLCAARAEFTLKPGPDKTWFVGKSVRVQYQRAAGFLIRRRGVPDAYRSDVNGVASLFTRGHDSETSPS